MRDPFEAVREAQNLVRRAREDGIKAHMRAQRMREDANKRIASSKDSCEKSKPKANG
jgi:hypothetical protein